MTCTSLLLYFINVSSFSKSINKIKSVQIVTQPNYLSHITFPTPTHGRIL